MLLGFAHAAAQGYPGEVEIPAVLKSSVRYELETLVEGLMLPVSLIPLDDGSERLLVVGLEGQLWLLQEWEPASEPFLSLAGRVTGRQGEQGLFTAALEPVTPDLVGPRRIIVAFTEAGTDDLLVAAYPLDDGLSSADRGGEELILRIEIPEPFHHGGQVAFGPDGMLYVSTGSGEISVHYLHDRRASARDLGNLRGKLLRLDISASQAGGAEGPYRVPSDNPFADGSVEGARPEVWASGFRNPWKFRFSPSGEIYLADVGQDRWEEVNLVVKGGDYGWPAREGYECMRFPDAPGLVEPACKELDLIDPVVAYGHLQLDPEGGHSVTGGAFPEDPLLPELEGTFVYGDFVTGRVWAYDPDSGDVTLLIESGMALTEVSTGPGGELLLVSIDGRIVRVRHAAN